jgi:hypothetical protein
MSEALTRVIDEQQKRIDDLLASNKNLIDRAENIFKKNDELFEAVGRLIDFRIKTDGWTDKEREYYGSLKHKVRMQMAEAGYCVHCYNWMNFCECDE